MTNSRFHISVDMDMGRIHSIAWQFKPQGKTHGAIQFTGERRLSRAKPVSKPSERAYSDDSARFRYGLRPTQPALPRQLNSLV
ncbi:hypothetical protein ACFL6S_13400 [Candidatus Poribacteria bacterium]